MCSAIPANRRTILPSPARKIFARTTASWYGQIGDGHGSITAVRQRNRVEALAGSPDVGVWNDIELDDLELRTERLILRALRGSDADAVHEAMQHRGMHEFLPLPDPYTTADAAEFVNVISQNGRRHGTGLDSALVERSSGALAGT